MLRFWQTVVVFSALVISSCLVVLDANALTVVPSLTEVSLAAGERNEFTIILKNDELKEGSFFLEAAEVRFTKQGTPQFIAGDDISADSLARWLSYEEGPYRLAVGEKKEIPVSLVVPEVISPGGYYGAIFAANLVDDKTISSVNAVIQTKVASLIFADVAGGEGGRVLIRDFTARKIGYWSAPASFAVEVENEGNTHFQPHGTIDVSGGWGGITQERLVVNEDFVYVMPGAAKNLIVNWLPAQPVKWGRYTASLRLSVAADQLIERQIIFWVLPYRFIAWSGGALGLVLIAWLARLVYRSNRGGVIRRR